MVPAKGVILSHRDHSGDYRELVLPCMLSVVENFKHSVKGNGGLSVGRGAIKGSGSIRADTRKGQAMRTRARPDLRAS